MRKLLIFTLLLCLISGIASAETYCIYTDDYPSYAFMVDDQGNLLTEKYAYGSIYSLSDTLYAAYPYNILDAISEEAVHYVTYGDYTYPEVDYYDYNRVALLDAQGNMLSGFDYFQLEYYEEAGVIVCIYPDQRCGVLDEQGQLLFRGDYGWILPNNKGSYLALKVDENYEPYSDQIYPLVWLDAEGNETDMGFQALTYMNPTSFDDCVAVNTSSESNIYHVFDIDGRALFSINADYMYDFYHGGAIVDLPDGNSGVLGSNGKWLIAPIYNYINQNTSYENGLIFCTTHNDEVVVYDGNTYEPILHFAAEDDGFISTWRLSENIFCVSSNSSESYFSIDGELLFALEQNGANYTYVDLYPLLGDSEVPEYIVLSEYNWPEQSAYLIDLEGNRVSEEFFSLSYIGWKDGVGLYMFCTAQYDDEGYPDWSTARYGICNHNGETLLEPIYTSISPLSFDRFWVSLGTNNYMIDLNGVPYLTMSDYEELLD